LSENITNLIESQFWIKSYIDHLFSVYNKNSIIDLILKIKSINPESYELFLSWILMYFNDNHIKTQFKDEILGRLNKLTYEINSI